MHFAAVFGVLACTTALPMTAQNTRQFWTTPASLQLDEIDISITRDSAGMPSLIVMTKGEQYTLRSRIGSGAAYHPDSLNIWLTFAQTVIDSAVRGKQVKEAKVLGHQVQSTQAKTMLTIGYDLSRSKNERILLQTNSENINSNWSVWLAPKSALKLLTFLEAELHPIPDPAIFTGAMQCTPVDTARQKERDILKNLPPFSGEGSVLTRLYIDSLGHIVDEGVSVIFSSGKQFTDVARNYWHGAEFTPAHCADGHATASRLELSIGQGPTFRSRTVIGPVIIKKSPPGCCERLPPH